MADPEPGSTPRPARGRVTRSRDFDAVYRRGRSAANRHMVMYTFAREAGSPEGPRLGLSVSKKVGGAVERNRVKRVLREQFAGLSDRVPDDHDVVVIARRGLAEYIDERGSGPVGERLAELVQRLFPERAVPG